MHGWKVKMREKGKKEEVKRGDAALMEKLGEGEEENGRRGSERDGALIKEARGRKRE